MFIYNAILTVYPIRGLCQLRSQWCEILKVFTSINTNPIYRPVVCLEHDDKAHESFANEKPLLTVLYFQS